MVKDAIFTVLTFSLFPTASRDECARAAAVIRWVVAQASACGCGAAALARDLLVLGVPRAHAAALADAAQEWAAGRQDRVKANGFMSKCLQTMAWPGGRCERNGKRSNVAAGNGSRPPPTRSKSRRMGS